MFERLWTKLVTARIVCDFEPGMLTTPDKQDVLAVNIILLNRKYRFVILIVRNSDKINYPGCRKKIKKVFDFSIFIGKY